MNLTNDRLNEEEYQLLSCNKEDWKKGQKKYSNFIEALGRYISIHGKGSLLYFESISFPEIVIDKNLISDHGLHMTNCNFYGKTTFKNLIFSHQTTITGCEFHNEVTFNNLLFHKNSGIYFNFFRKPALFYNMVFKEEIDFDTNTFDDNVIFQNFSFSGEASFWNTLLLKECKILNFKGAELMVWDELFCIYDTDECYWDEREKYLLYFQNKSIDSIESFALVREIKELFKNDARAVKDILTNREQIDLGCYIWLEAFADVTKQLFKNKNYGKAVEHLNFMNKKLHSNNEEIKKVVDVSYVENLLYDLKPKEKKEAWKYFPDRIKKAYTSMWTIP